jgi:N6-adenosine-specific RNA methylase IME4
MNACAGYLELFAHTQWPGWTTWGNEPAPYNGEDDFAKSIDVAYEAVRKRLANGGPPWTPKPVARLR